jgi:hypothetical protein
MIIAEAGNTILPGQVRLRFARFRNTKIVKTEISGQVRLVVPAKKRTRFGDIRPLGKSFSPPRVVFRNRMKLRQIKGNNSWSVSGE